MKNHILTASALLAGRPDRDEFGWSRIPVAENLRLGQTGDPQVRAVPGVPAGAKLVVAVGDPSKLGPYVVRVTVPNGVKMMPHVHPEDRIYTIISGVS
jgi:hypothetical protein